MVLDNLVFEYKTVFSYKVLFSFINHEIALINNDFSDRYTTLNKKDASVPTGVTATFAGINDMSALLSKGYFGKDFEGAIIG